MSNGIERKRQLLMAELQRYFGETCPELVARCEAAFSRGPSPWDRILVASGIHADQVRAAELDKQTEGAVAVLQELAFDTPSRRAPRDRNHTTFDDAARAIRSH